MFYVYYKAHMSAVSIAVFGSWLADIYLARKFAEKTYISPLNMFNLILGPYLFILTPKCTYHVMSCFAIVNIIDDCSLILYHKFFGAGENYREYKHLLTYSIVKNAVVLGIASYLDRR